MANPQYAKGTRAERELMVLAVECGASVYRGAGSHGAYDVVVSMPNGIRYLVNIKCNAWAGPAERQRLWSYSTVVDRPLLAMKVDRKGWRFRAIEADGVMGPTYSIAPWE